MSNMDYDYWNLNPLVLDKGEEVKQELLKYYELGYDEDSKTEETAYNEVKYIVRDGCNLDELFDLINYEKLKAAVSLICTKYELDDSDFDICVDGIDISVAYQHDRIA